VAEPQSLPPRSILSGEFDQQPDFDRLITDLAARFVRILPERVDEEIGKGLRLIVQTLGFDRSTLLQLSGGGDHLVVTHSWPLPGLTPIPEGISLEECPWTLSRVQRGEAVVVSQLEYLREEAWRDQKVLRRLGIKSKVIVPLASGGNVLGAVAFGTMRREQSWPPALVSRLRLLAGILASALERKRADFESRAAFNEIQRLRDLRHERNTCLREVTSESSTSRRMVGQSAAIQGVIALVQQVAPTDAPVLLMGETGVGKDLLAEALHASSHRRHRTMVKVNCATLPASLIESELFGREKGAYTGALTKQIGRFELADHSTLFLDEVAELPLDLQSKLLRFLQTGEFERLGSPRTIRVNVRIVAATNRDLEKEVVEGRFRDDLYYRLAVFPISVPPLRERSEDIALLVQAMVDELGRKMGKRIDAIAEKSFEQLAKYAWPGNVRELRNVVERAIILNRSQTLVIDVPERRDGTKAPSLALEDVERHHIVSVLELTEWRIRGERGAAAVLELQPTTLEARMAKLGIHRPPNSNIS
jgi:formate hydrogenlyase transcriptional activator